VTLFKSITTVNSNISEQIKNVKFNSTLGISKSDFEDLQIQIQNLEATQQAMIKAFIEGLPEPKTEDDKANLGDRIVNFINEHSLPITQGIGSSVFYDVLKEMFKQMKSIF
jgi:hypothetical protein